MDTGVALRRRGRRGFRAADLRPRARRELEHAERLRDVVVGARIQQIDFFMLRMARRQHDDRHGGAPPDLAADVDAVHIREAEIEHHEIGAIRRGGIDAGGSIRGLVDASGDVAQCVAHGEADLGLVVDDENEIGVRHTQLGHGLQDTRNVTGYHW